MTSKQYADDGQYTFGLTVLLKKVELYLMRSKEDSSLTMWYNTKARKTINVPSDVPIENLVWTFKNNKLFTWDEHTQTNWYITDSKNSSPTVPIQLTSNQQQAVDVVLILSVENSWLFPKLYIAKKTDESQILVCLFQDANFGQSLHVNDDPQIYYTSFVHWTTQAQIKQNVDVLYDEIYNYFPGWAYFKKDPVQNLNWNPSLPSGLYHIKQDSQCLQNDLKLVPCSPNDPLQQWRYNSETGELNTPIGINQHSRQSLHYDKIKNKLDTQITWCDPLETCITDENAAGNLNNNHKSFQLFPTGIIERETGQCVRKDQTLTPICFQTDNCTGTTKQECDFNNSVETQWTFKQLYYDQDQQEKPSMYNLVIDPTKQAFGTYSNIRIAPGTSTTSSFTSPTDQEKCCKGEYTVTDNKSGTNILQLDPRCGLDWRPWSTNCATNTNVITDYCSGMDGNGYPRLNTDINCQSWCNSPENKGKCSDAVNKFCEQYPQHYSCTCRMLDKTPFWSEMIQTFKSIPGCDECSRIPPYQCWAAPCTKPQGNSPDRTLMSEQDLEIQQHCPPVTFCNQIIEIVKASGPVNISNNQFKQVCGVNLPSCNYKYGDWSICQNKIQTSTGVLVSDPSNDNDCKTTITKTQICSDSNPTPTPTPNPNPKPTPNPSPNPTPTPSPITNCKYDYGTWSLCVNETKSSIGKLTPDSDKTCDQTNIKQEPCTKIDNIITNTPSSYIIGGGVGVALICIVLLVVLLTKK